LQGHYTALRARLLTDGPAGDKMCLTYRQLIQTLLATRP